MKIAVITDDQKTISQHFGQARYYLVFTIENGQEVGRELRDKLGHSHFSNQPHGEEGGQPHGFGPAAHDRHTQMAQTIADCDALLCRGMGAGAYSSMLALGIRPVVTDVASVEEAVQQYVQGRLVDHPEKLH